jgi:mRNA-degrading endonuclease RelE of RelBE toxin-antitoxin system
MPHVRYETETFAAQWKKLCKKDKPLEEKLTEVVNGIIAHPENFDSPLQGDRNRSLKKKAVSEHYRIIYRYCERCLGVFKTQCDICVNSQCPNNAIIFEEVFHRDDGY